MVEILKGCKLNLEFEFEELAKEALDGYANNDKALEGIRALLIAFDRAPETFNNKPIIKTTPTEKMMVESTAIALTYREAEKSVTIHNITYKTRRVPKEVWDDINKNSR